MCATSRASCATAPRPSSSTSKAIRVPSCSTWSTKSGPISARSCRSCRAKSPVRRAGSPGGERGSSRDDRAPARARHPRQPVCRRRAQRDPLAASIGADRVELYTEPFVRALSAAPSRPPLVRAVRRVGAAGARARSWRQRGDTISTSRTCCFPRTAVPRRGFNRPRDRAGALRGPRPRRARVSGRLAARGAVV